MTQQTINLYEITIAELLDAYRAGKLDPVTVTARYLERIAAYDRAGQHLNSVIVMNPQALQAAAEAAHRWRTGTARALEGIPFTVKDSYMVKGLTVASGSPAFAGLTAQWDAFTVQQLLQAGAVLLGKTNMPPMADGGMQRGVYGRAENPYNQQYLAAAYASGSSNGSGVATAANLAVFGMGEETVSSGRSPASNNGLCAYTPSWGVISIRGNWPLFPARDVVVPHTRTMADMLQLLNVLVVDDLETRGDFWRHQQVVELPAASAVRPADYNALFDPQALAGKVLAVPRMYLGKDERYPMPLRPSVLELWEQTRARLEALGATVVETDFPVIEEYERDHPAGEQIAELGVLPPGWMETEFNHFLAFGWDDFLRANQDPQYPNLGTVDPDTIFPLAPGTLPDRYEEVPDYANGYRAVVKYAQQGISDPRKREDFAAGLRALLQLRKSLFEHWLQEHGYDAVVFPANADIGTEDAERVPEANDHTWLNGVLFSNGNYALRHFGIPTVTVSMGATSDIGVPVGVTFAGAAYHDSELLQFAAALDADGFVRPTPQAAPQSVADELPLATAATALTVTVQQATVQTATVQTATVQTATVQQASAVAAGEKLRVTVRGRVSLPHHNSAVPALQLGVTVNGETAAAVTRADGEFSAELLVQKPDFGLNPDPRRLLVVVRPADSANYSGAASCEIAY